MFKKEFILLCGLLALGQSLFAQDYYKHNFDLTAGGGLQSAQFSPEKGGDHKAKFGWVVDGIYRRQFNEHWGVGGGLGLAFYKAQTQYDNLMLTCDLDNEYKGVTGDFMATFNDWDEDQKVIELEVPVAAYYQTRVNEKWTFICDLGAKLMIPVWNEYKSVSGYIENTGYFDCTNITYSNLPQYNLTRHDYFCGSSDIKAVTGAGFVDAGMMYDLKRDKKLYMGVYFSYTFTNLATKSNDMLYNGKEYVGVVSSDNVDNAHLMAAGVKIGITFGRPRVEQDTVKVVTVEVPVQVPVEVKVPTVDSTAIKEAQRRHQQQLDSMRLAEARAKMERERLQQEKDSLQRVLAEKEKMKSTIKWLNTNLKVNFEKSQAHVDDNDDNNKHIAVLKEYILNNPDKKIIVTGHTCNLGKEETNIKLGLKRAEAVKQVMIAAGIPAENIVCKSMGSKQPLVPNTTEENRRKNRRVELAVE